MARERRALDPRADDGDFLSSASLAAAAAAAVASASASAVVGLAELPGVLGHLARLDRVHALCACLRGEQRQDAAPCTDVDDDFALEVGLGKFFFLLLLLEKKKRELVFFFRSFFALSWGKKKKKKRKLTEFSRIAAQ